jgi:hypothetical protein
MATFNRTAEVAYRAIYLKEPLDAIARAVGLRGKQSVRKVLDRAEADERVMRAVAMRASAEEKKLDEEFKR